MGSRVNIHEFLAIMLISFLKGHTVAGDPFIVVVGGKWRCRTIAVVLKVKSSGCHGAAIEPIAHSHAIVTSLVLNVHMTYQID